MVFNSPKEKFIFFNISIILFSLIPFFLITGPFLSDLSISLISLLFLIYCIKEKNFSYFKNKYFYFFLLFWLYLISNSLIFNFSLDSLGTSIVYVRYGIFVIAIIALLDFDHKFIKYFFYCILVCFSALIIDGFFQYFSGKNIFGYMPTNQFRVSSFFFDELILGSYLSRLWPIFFGLSIIIFNQKSKPFFIFIIIFILSEVLIFLSGERTAFFYINLSAVFVILFSQRLLKLRLFSLLSSILLLTIITFINPIAKERIIDHTLQGMNVINSEDIADSSDQSVNTEVSQIYFFTKSHHEIYISAYKMFLDNKIMGVGVKNYRNECNNPKYFINGKDVCSTHPHNTYMQILSETGIIGFLFLAFLLFIFCKYMLKHIICRFQRKSYFNDFEICILSGIVIYLWPIVPTLNVFNNWLNILMILNLPFFIWSRKSINLRESNKYI